ncbi:MAG: NfeD family protein [Chloroflexota bacterium]
MVAPRSRRPIPPLALLVLALILPALAGILATGARAATEPTVTVLPLDGPIVPPVADWLAGEIAAANERGDALIVIELDTPGGLMASSDRIVRAILDSAAPVAVWVAPENARAASAGVFVTYAAGFAAMAPGTRIGAASPVGGDGGDLDDTMARKVTNDAVSQLRALAERSGRNAGWAEAAVREAASVTAEEALRLGVIDAIAPDLPTLLATADGRPVRTAAGSTVIETAGATVSTAGMGWLAALLTLLSTPAIAYLLLTIGGFGLFMELSSPGALFPGVTGALCLLLGLYGLGTLPVNWTGALLIGLAFLLFVADLFVPSFGILTIGGLVSFILGSTMLIDRAVAPALAIPRPLIWLVAAVIGLLAIAVAAFVARSHRTKPATGREGLLGAVGLSRQDLAPDGVVFVGGELWQATAADGAAIPAGAPVAVSGLDGLRLIVRRATAPEAATAGVAILPPPPPLPADPG